jgi:pimeloyl-ACP methyl ester carboxylesterase
MIGEASSSVEVEGGRLHVEVAGEGAPVVLLHPGLWDSRTWDDQWDAFAARHRVVRYDLRGYGRSTRPTGAPYSHVRDLLAVMDHVGIGRAALVGCSMGGGVALDAALSAPDRVSALVLAAAALGGYEGTEEDEREWQELFDGLGALVEAGDLDRAQDARLRVWAPLGVHDPAGRRIRDIAFDNLHDLTMDESAAEELSPPAIARLEEVACPTLVMPADHDPGFSRRESAIMAERIPGARLVEIPDVDHVLNMRAPERFNEAVLGFLEER